MLCRDIMKTKIECVTPTDAASAAAAKMRDANIGFLPVCDGAGKVVGVVTDRDIAIRLVAEQRSFTLPVSEIMTREVVFCRPDDDLEEAKKQMAERRKSRVVCLDDQDTLVGVISLSDLIGYDEVGAARTMTEVSQREVHVH